MPAAALISDLMMQSQVAAAAQRAAVELVVAGTEDTLLAAVESQQPSLVIVDLSHPGLDVGRLYARLEPLLAPGATTLAFGPHVHKARLEAASAAGFTRVLSRGQFHAQLDRLLAGQAD